MAETGPNEELSSMARRLHALAAVANDPIQMAQLNAAASQIEISLMLN